MMGCISTAATLKGKAATARVRGRNSSSGRRLMIRALDLGMSYSFPRCPLFPCRPELE